MVCECLVTKISAVITAVALVAVLVCLALLAKRISNGTFPIDFVITWVDGADDAWRSRLAETKRRLGPQSDEMHNADREPDRARATEHDIGYYAVVTAARFMPWLRTIWVLTERPHRPAWIRAVRTRIPIRVVHHDECFDADVTRPTYNSAVIESQMYNIPGLAEHFIYSNDDILALRPLDRTDFFLRDGTPVTMAAPFVDDPSRDAKWDGMLRRTVAFAKRIGSSHPHLIPAHAYTSQRKSVGRAVSLALRTEVRAMRPIRGDADFVLQYVACMFADKHDHKKPPAFKYYNTGDDFANDAQSSSAALVCINGAFSKSAEQKLRTLLRM